MDLPTLLPWLWWAILAVACARWARARAGGFAALAVVALGLATLHQFGWNKPIYQFGRGLLQDAGVYERRIVFKLAIGAVFAPLAVWLLWRLIRWARRLSLLQGVALAAMVVDLLFITVRTLSIDGWLPLAIGDEPGKSRFGAAVAAVALLATLVAPRGRAGEQSTETEHAGQFLVRRR